MMKSNAEPVKDRGLRSNCASFFVVILCVGLLRGQQVAPVTSQAKIQVEVVTLRDGGFYPSTLIRPAGNFLLVVKNRSHATEVELGIARSDATVVVAAEQVITINRDYILDLPGGTYTLRDSSHPKWVPLSIITH